jgi:hypothetical protein
VKKAHHVEAVDRPALRRVQKAVRARVTRDRVQPPTCVVGRGTASLVTRTRDNSAVAKKREPRKPKRLSEPRRQPVREHETVAPVVAPSSVCPSIVLEFPDEIVQLYTSLYQKTQGYVQLVAYLTNTLVSYPRLPGTMPALHAPAQAIGYRFVLHPKVVYWCVGMAPDVQNASIPKQVMPGITGQDTKLPNIVRYEQVFVVDRAYPVMTALKRVLEDAHTTLRLVGVRLARMGYMTA